MESNKIFLFMCLNDVAENEYYTDEEEVAKQVEEANRIMGQDGDFECGDFWYMTLNKKD